MLQGKHLWRELWEVLGEGTDRGGREEDMGGTGPWAVGRGNIAGHSVMEADQQ